MALTKIGGGVLRQPIDVGIITATSLNASGIVTAGTVQVGAATTIHTTGIDLGSGNVTSHNINSTGIITATSFVGPVTGNTSGTASNLSGSPSINVTNITASGNVSIAGTLTYEDVTNIDSVGIITAQAGIRLDDSITHLGDTDTKIRFPAADTISFECAGEEILKIGKSSTELLRISGPVDGSTQQEFGIGIAVNDAHTHPAAKITLKEYDASDSRGDLLFYTRGTNNDVASTERLRITSAGLVGIGLINPDAKLQVNGNAVIGTDNVGLVEFTSTGVPYFAVAADANNYRSTRINVVSGGGYADLSFDTMGIAAKTGLPSAGSLVKTIMYLDASSQRVGIGTDNPSELLHLQSGHTKQILKSTNLNTASSVIFDVANVNTADFLLGQLAGRWNGTDVAYINFEAGADTTNKDDGIITFLTSASGGSPTERLRITSAGRLLIGGSSVTRNSLFNSAGWTTQVQIENTSDQKSSLSLICSHATNNQAGLLALGATKSSTLGGNAITGATQGLGILTFQGNDGSQMVEAARIACVADGTPAADNLPGSLRFSTNGGAAGATERLRITSGGNVGVNDSAPSSLLSISETNGNAKLQIKRANTANNTDDYGSILWRSSGGTAVGAINVARSTGEDNGYMFFQTASGGSMSEQMRIQPNGYIGIGEIAPGGKLTVKHANTATSGLNATLKLKQGVATNGNRSSLIFSSLDDYDVAAVNGVVDTHSGTAANNVGHLEFWTKESGNATAQERMRVHSTGEVSINSTGYLGRFHIQQAAITEPPLSIRFHDASIYKNMGTVGPNDRNGNTTSTNGQYLHVRVRTVWNDSSMTMFRITGYYPYSDYTHSFVGMYRYGHASYRTTPYGSVIHNLKRSTIHSIYNTAADPGYLVFVCDWNNSYTGLMFEHLGAGAVYGSYMQNDIEIIDSLRSTGTGALTF